MILAAIPDALNSFRAWCHFLVPDDSRLKREGISGRERMTEIVEPERFYSRAIDRRVVRLADAADRPLLVLSEQRDEG